MGITGCQGHHGQTEKQISTVVDAVTTACYEPVLQNTTEQWEMHFAQTSAALHESRFTAHQYEERISKGLTAVR